MSRLPILFCLDQDEQLRQDTDSLDPAILNERRIKFLNGL